jgi:hypothetical protein
MRGRGLGLVREERLSMAGLLESAAALLIKSLCAHLIRHCVAIGLPVPDGIGELLVSS